MDDRRRPDGLDRELARAFAHGDGTTLPGGHLDAEHAAALMEGSLGVAARAETEAHVAGCHECQALLAALVRVTPDPPTHLPLWAWLRQPWLVPVMAGAAAVAIYVAVPTTPPSPPDANRALITRDAEKQAADPSAAPPAAPRESDTRAVPPAAPAATPAQGQAAAVNASAPKAQAARVETRAADAVSAEPARRDVESVPAPPAPAAPAITPRREALADSAANQDPGGDAFERKSTAATPPGLGERQDERPETSSAPAARARVPIAGAAESARALPPAAFSARERQPLQVTSADGGARWRQTGSGLEYAPRSGAPWLAAILSDGDAARLTTGSAPGGTVCWMAGRAGLVVVSTDGRRFLRVAAPAAVDILGIVAAGERAAIVTTTDGRRFQTLDRGTTWSALAP